MLIHVGRRRMRLTTTTGVVASALLFTVSACAASKRFSVPGCQRIIHGVHITKALKLLGPRPLSKTMSGGEVLVKRSACELGGTHVEQEFIPADSLDATFVLTSDGHAVTVPPRERVGFDAGSYGINPTMACLADRLFIYANPILGTVEASDPVGTLRWTKRLRPFHSLKSLELEQANVGQLSDALNSTASIVTQVLASRQYVAIEWRTGREGIRQLILDEHGVEVARIGPWDGLLTGAADDGWTAVVGGGPDVTSYSGLCKVDLVLQVKKP